MWASKKIRGSGPQYKEGVVMEITAVSAHTTNDGTAYSMTVQFDNGKEVVAPLHEMQYRLLMEAMQAEKEELAVQEREYKPVIKPVFSKENHLNRLVQHFNNRMTEEQVTTFQTVEDSDNEPLDLGEQVPLRGGLGGVRQL